MVGSATLTMKKSTIGRAAPSRTVSSPRVLSAGAGAGDEGGRGRTRGSGERWCGPGLPGGSREAAPGPVRSGSDPFGRSRRPHWTSSQGGTRERLSRYGKHLATGLRGAAPWEHDRSPRRCRSPRRRDRGGDGPRRCGGRAGRGRRREPPARTGLLPAQPPRAHLARAGRPAARPQAPHARAAPRGGRAARRGRRDLVHVAGAGARHPGLRAGGRRHRPRADARPHRAPAPVHPGRAPPTRTRTWTARACPRPCAP